MNEERPASGSLTDDEIIDSRKDKDKLNILLTADEVTYRPPIPGVDYVSPVPQLGGGKAPGEPLLANKPHEPRKVKIWKPVYVSPPGEDTMIKFICPLHGNQLLHAGNMPYRGIALACGCAWRESCGKLIRTNVTKPYEEEQNVDEEEPETERAAEKNKNSLSGSPVVEGKPSLDQNDFEPGSDIHPPSDVRTESIERSKDGTPSPVRDVDVRDRDDSSRTEANVGENPEEHTGKKGDKEEIVGAISRDTDKVSRRRGRRV